MTSAIAIVGMACRYPDAHSPQQLWETVLAQRTAFRKLPQNASSSATTSALSTPLQMPSIPNPPP